MSPNKIRISSASGKTASQLAIGAGIDVRKGDITDPTTLVAAFQGSDALFLVSYPSVGMERFEYHRNAIDAAKQAGVKHILYTSLSWGGPTGEKSIASVLHAHIKTVEYLKQSGLTWTILRYATYNHLWTNVAGFLRLEDKTRDADVVIPHDGPNHFASRKEMGEATARVLAEWVSITFPFNLRSTDDAFHSLSMPVRLLHLPVQSCLQFGRSFKSTMSTATAT
jgi:uncharacterized protein YbjT (DUF2867 family)